MQRCNYFSSLTNQHRQHKGFTLVELMVVVAIVGILTALAAPSFTQYSAGKRMRALVSDFATSMRLTRSEAIKRNRVVTMCRTTTPDSPAAVCANGNGDWRDGWIIFEDNATFGTRQATEVILFAQPAKLQDGSILPNGNGAYVPSFSPLGTPRTLAILQGVQFLPNIPNANTSPVRSIMCINATGRMRIDTGASLCATQ